MDLNPAAVEAAAKAIDQALLEFYQTSITIDGEARVAAKAALFAAAPLIVRATADAIADHIGAVEGELINLPSDMGEPIADRRLKIAGLVIAAGIARSFGSTAPEGPKP